MTVASYGLAPMQQGMLFVHLSSPGGDVDLEQIVMELHEPLHTEAHGGPSASSKDTRWRAHKRRAASLR